MKYVSTGISTYRVPDWLGSLRISSNPNRTYAWGVAFAPYGERYASKNSPAFTFTGQNEDNVSGLYDFLYREESNAQGRWISPDPAGLSAVNIANPQTWNRYTYVGNNPLSFTDQLGLFQGDALGNGDDGCYLTFSCTVFTDSFGMQISSQFAQQALHNGSGVICQSCFGQAEQIGADNSISAVAVDFFRKTCSGPVSGGLAGALGKCTTSFIGSGLIQVGMLADIWYPPPANNCQPPFLSNPVDSKQPKKVGPKTLSWWDKAGLVVACIAGMDPEFAAPMGSDSQASDSTDSTSTTEGQGTPLGPNKGGRSVPYGGSPEIPSGAAGGAAYGAGVGQCITNVFTAWPK